MIRACSTKEWNYFSKKDFFDIDNDLGYTEEDFDEKWDFVISHQKSLIKFLENITNENAEVGE